MSRESEIGLCAGGLAPLPAVAPGLVRLRAVDNPALGVVAELDGPVTPGGYGQWGQIERPRKLPLTTYTGLAPLVLPIPILLDRWQSSRSVEPEIKAIETMLGRHGVDRPSPVTVEGPGIPFSFERDESLRFVLTEPSWGDDVRTTGLAGERAFVQLTITAMQYTPLSEDDDGKARKYFKVTKANPNKLRGIAKKHKITVKKIKQLNKDRKGIPGDPDKVIKPGVMVRVS